MSQSRPRLRVLLIGGSFELLNPAIFLFSRAGFLVDVLVNFFLLKNKFINEVEKFESLSDLASKLSEKNLDCYDLVSICDDGTLKNIAGFDLPLHKKLKLLPVS